MTKETITYTDLNGVQRTEDFTSTCPSLKS